MLIVECRFSFEDSTKYMQCIAKIIATLFMAALRSRRGHYIFAL